MIRRISHGEVLSKAKIILSESSNGLTMTSTMAAAICYAWLLQNREEEDVAVMTVVNIERGRMNKKEEAAWLFFHVGIDASALLFADKVDLDNLLMNRLLTIIIPSLDCRYSLEYIYSFVAKSDVEAVQLLLAGSSPDYRHELFEQLMQDHNDSLFLEALKKLYGKATHDYKLCKIIIFIFSRSYRNYSLFVNCFHFTIF
ncbi:hypothetical protein ZIOFF_056220 [Zingiber officinale]|uniref:Uncharacterized protein n=1 Tax=Zingiber officinale TaxID=94328 RepID=A0A8J5FIR9_ZINOF|nr:hypothetical protein ZIOFF_056220 [Zingiber officinale]